MIILTRLIQRHLEARIKLILDYLEKTSDAATCKEYYAASEDIIRNIAIHDSSKTPLSLAVRSLDANLQKKPINSRRITEVDSFIEFATEALALTECTTSIELNVAIAKECRAISDAAEMYFNLGLNERQDVKSIYQVCRLNAIIQSAEERFWWYQHGPSTNPYRQYVYSAFDDIAHFVSHHKMPIDDAIRFMDSVAPQCDNSGDYKPIWDAYDNSCARLRQIADSLKDTAIRSSDSRMQIMLQFIQYRLQTIRKSANELKYLQESEIVFFNAYLDECKLIMQKAYGSESSLSAKNITIFTAIAQLENELEDF